MSDDLSVPDARLESAVVKLTERVRALQEDLGEVRTLVADADKRLKRLELGAAVIVVTLAGGGGVMGLLGGIFGGG